MNYLIKFIKCEFQPSFKQYFIDSTGSGQQERNIPQTGPMHYVAITKGNGHTLNTTITIILTGFVRNRFSVFTDSRKVYSVGIKLKCSA